MTPITLTTVDAATDAATEAVDATTNALQSVTNSIVPSFLQGYVNEAISVAVVTILCLIGAKLVLGAVNKALSSMNIEMTLLKFIRSILRIVVYFIVILIVAGQLGINTSSVVALASVLSAAFALAAQNALGNLFGGILLLITKPFLVGDYVAAGGIEGTVLEIGLLATQINTFDNKRISVPNGTISAATITNYSTEGKRRVDLTVTAAYESTVDATKLAIFQAIGATPGVLREPMAPFVRVNGYGESSIEYAVRVWAENANYWSVYYDLLENIKVAFDRNGVEMPYNHLNVHMVKD